MDLKPFIIVMKFIDSIYLDPQNGYYYDNLERFFKGYKFNEKFLNGLDYLYEKVEIDEYEEYKELSIQYGDISENKRLDLVIAFYNLIYFSEEPEEIKIKLSNFLYRYNIKLDNNLEYRSAINISEDEIWEGSYGIVCPITDNHVLKQLKSQYWKDRDVSSRFKNEFKIQEKLRDLGGNVLSVFDYDPTRFSFIMERADCDIYEYLENNIIANEEKMIVINDVLTTLKLAHENNVVHRDLHYGNILIRDGKAYVSDFGFAKDAHFLRSVMSTATPKPNHYFVAPEGFRDFGELDERSDIFSVGKMVDYIMGDGCFGTNHIYKIFVEKCTKNNKEDRYESIGEVMERFALIKDAYDSETRMQDIRDSIKNSIYNESVEEYILMLSSKGEISNFMVSQGVNLSEIFLKLSSVTNKEKVIKDIMENFINSTGYNGWENYDIFGRFAYAVLISEQNLTIQRFAYSILKECASRRYIIKDLFNEVPFEIKDKFETVISPS